ncbi:MAG TPA: heavy metal translocating P-type ATPase, partial [Rhodospirillales bacterium]
IRRINLMVDNVHCANCIKRIEDALTAMPGVTRARVNMSTRRLVVEWRGAETAAPALLARLAALGYPAAPFDADRLAGQGDSEERRLLTALAVAGFAAGNVMLLSISVWAGAGGDMGEATRGLFHWLSALIALPAVAYAGQPFFRSAWRALKARALNMDVPISLAVVLAASMSLQQTVAGGEHAYFDASVTLLFFLLIGRYLDRRARAKARSAAEHLLTLAGGAARAIDADGRHRTLPLAEVRCGMRLAVAAGERIPADGAVACGRSEIDASLVTGESLPAPVGTGDRVFAGTTNLAAPIEVTVTAVGEDTLLAEIVRLMEAAEQSRARYVRLADRVAKVYAPAVHVLALSAFLGWWLLAGAGWQTALMVAVAVLIITCPCALGLAVPAVQVVASGRLMQHGVLLKSADGLERLAQIDTVVFDKTGTLTTGRPALVNGGDVGPADLALAAALARHSRHPLSRALAAAAPATGLPAVADIAEIPGSGLSGRIDGVDVRLGRREWCAAAEADAAGDAAATAANAEIWLVRAGTPPVRFVFADTLRPDAAATLGRLKRMGLDCLLLSGDRRAAVADAARRLGIDDFEGECLPGAKVARLQALARQGRKVLMVGDGLNDAPALAAGFASMSPATAADISRTAADLVFQGELLAPVAAAVRTARLAGSLVRQNFTLALAYNLVAVPVAMAGLATPLVAAVAMSSSSLVVTLNALRLRLMAWEAR